MDATWGHLRAIQRQGCRSRLSETSSVPLGATLRESPAEAGGGLHPL